MNGILGRRVARLLGVLALLGAGACSEPAMVRQVEAPAQAPITPVSQVRERQKLECVGNVRTQTVECQEPKPVGAAQRIFGNQDVYVRLTSSAVAYNGGTQIFSFNVTVQNLVTQSMATSDGATRHDSGVQVFFSAPPTTLTGSGAITVANGTGQATFTATNQDYFQYGGKIGGVDQPELGADGILSPAEVSSAKAWQLNMPNTVGTFSFTLYVSTETPSPAPLVTIAPQITNISASPLIPGASVTITGINFNATPASNVVSFGTQNGTVTGGTTTQLNVTVPCVGSGPVAVRVTQGGMRGAAFTGTMQPIVETVGVGSALVITNSAQVACSELASAGGAARYVVAVYSASTSPSSNDPFQLSADVSDPLQVSVVTRTPEAGTLARVAVPAGLRTSAQEQLAEQKHTELLERNAEMYQTLRKHFGPTVARRVGAQPVQMDPALTRTFRVANINVGGFCNSYYVVSATRVYYNGKLAIYEDDATPDAFKGALNATMAANYLKIGDQFNADMEPVVRNNFGDILRRDAELDNNGIEIALFTPRINTSFSGVAGYVVSCDQFPNDDANSPAVGGPYTGSATNGSSNFGEVFYAYEPVTAGTGYSGNTADNWYRTIRSTFIHESKHIAAYSARVANNAPTFEVSWLEEGMARTSEEMWMRQAVDNVAWKGNTQYGSFANPINIYCDVRPGFAECDANTRRPASIMQRHFTSLYTNMFGTNARLLSPFGATASDNASYFYATSWSLIRYSLDRYGSSDAAFLTGLTNSTTSGATNLTAQAGVSIDQLLGGWALSFDADDYPGLGSPSPDIQMPTWNLRNIYAGLNTDFPATYTLPYPLVAQARTFGSFAPVGVTTLRGGGVLWYEISGTQTLPQLLRLQANGGGTPTANMRIAIARLQ